MPKVSILSPTYNHEKYISQAIKSVLNQTLQDFELIIGDDASTDRTIEKILKFEDSRLILLRNDRNLGTSATSLKCWQKSKGEYITVLATDDMYEPHMLAVLSNYLDNHPEVLAVFGMAAYIDEDGNPLRDGWTEVGIGQNRFVLLNQLFKLQHPFCSITGMFRRSTLNTHGYFPTYLRQTDDMGHFIKLLFHGEMPILPDRVLRYRWQANKGNVSSRTPENDARLDFELFEILDLYREHIHSIDLLEKIFPEVAKHPWPRDKDIIPFHLAHIAISFNYTSHRLYGMHLLYNMLKDEVTAQQLLERCHFSYTDFFRLAGEYPLIMNKALRDEIEALKSENDSLKNTVTELAAQIKSMTTPHSFKTKLKRKLGFFKSPGE